MDPMSWAFWQAVGTAVLCGGAVGVEREVNDKPAGLRTCMFVCLGAMLFVRLGAELEGDVVDPGRVLAQVISGIGFLGAGVIFGRGSLVSGVTTASTIWVLAAIGCMIGLDHLAAAYAITAVVLAVLILFGPVSQSLSRHKAAGRRTDDEQ